MALKVSPRTFRFGINLYPPYLGAGIRCHHMSNDWREARVSLKLRWYNRNFVGTQFGGSLYSMTDAFNAVMLLNVIGHDYWVWDQNASIEYIKPGRKRVHAVFQIDGAMIERVLAATADGEKHLEQVVNEIVDDDGVLIARVARTLYVRKKRKANAAREQHPVQPR